MTRVCAAKLASRSERYDKRRLDLYSVCVWDGPQPSKKTWGFFTCSATRRHPPLAAHYRGHHGAASVLARRNYGACSNELRTQIGGFLFSIFGSLMSEHAA